MLNTNRVAVIDADSIVWAIAYKYSEEDINDREQVETMHLQIRTGISEIIEKANAEFYIGFIAGSQKTKKYEIAKHRPYKGKRPDKPEWMRTWGQECQRFMLEELNFVETTEAAEVDDYVIKAAQILDLDTSEFTPIICSTDKDLKIYPGPFLNIFKGTYEEITYEEAEVNFWTLVAMGDASDNICGIPRCGKETATKIIIAARAAGIPIETAIKEKFIAYYYSDYYGEMIFNETVELVAPLDVDMSLGFVKSNMYKLNLLV